MSGSLMPDAAHDVALTVNGTSYRGTIEARMLLSDFLRHELKLAGTHVGCEHGVCGACTVLLDGAPVRSCLMFAVQANGSTLSTIEGLASASGDLSPLQAAMHDHDGVPARAHVAFGRRSTRGAVRQSLPLHRLSEHRRCRPESSRDDADGRAMTTRFFGAPIKRNEDKKLLTGRALFIDDVELPGMVHAAFLRSQVAHAR